MWVWFVHQYDGKADVVRESEQCSLLYYYSKGEV